MNFRKIYCAWMMMLMAMLMVLCQTSTGWVFENDENGENVGLAEGDSCRIRSGGPGVCKRIDTCEPYYEGLRKKTIQYSFLVRCSLIGFIEVICCPETSTGSVRHDRPEATLAPTTTTSTTTTTTTIRPIVIGDVTITGDHEFVDLSKIVRQTSSTTTTQRPRDQRLELMRPNNNQQNFNWGLPNSRHQMVPGVGFNVQWPNQQAFPQQPRQRQIATEWFNPLAGNNQGRGQISQNFVQFPMHPVATGFQNSNNNPLTNLLRPFQFRPSPDDSILAGSSTLKTIIGNELGESTDRWSWSDATTPRRRTSTTVTTMPTQDWVKPNLPDWMNSALSSSTTTSTTPTPSPLLTESTIPDWVKAALSSTTTITPIPESTESEIPDWVNAALSSSTTPTITTPSSQINEPTLPDWMQAALNVASTEYSSIPSATPTSIPVIPISVTPSPTSTIRTVTTRNENERPSQTACRRYSSLNPTGLTFHILDGTPAAPGDYPHMGGLIYQSGGGSDIDVRCGTSLISERYTLTAAHCANDDIAQPIMVRFGVVILTASEDGIEPLDVEIESIALHPDYRAQFRYHDVAVIKLRKDVEFTTYIRPACLYSDLSDVDSNIPLAVIGWGVTNVQTRSRSGVLLVANLTSVPLDQCNRTHTENGVSRSYKNGLNDGQYCAYDIALQKDACQADSGGPLQLVQKQVSTIVGIVSFGLSCGSAIPSVYARVAFYLNWIESVVWP